VRSGLPVRPTNFVTSRSGLVQVQRREPMRLSDDGSGVDIFFSDFSPEAQEELLDLLGVESPEEGNWDVLPITNIPIDTNEDEVIWNSDEYLDKDEDEEDLDNHNLN
jgi:hypothetical protein